MERVTGEQETQQKISYGKVGSSSVTAELSREIILEKSFFCVCINPIPLGNVLRTVKVGVFEPRRVCT
jgi:hypothetical protein